MGLSCKFSLKPIQWIIGNINPTFSDRYPGQILQFAWWFSRTSWVGSAGSRNQLPNTDWLTNVHCFSETVDVECCRHPFFMYWLEWLQVVQAIWSLNENNIDVLSFNPYKQQIPTIITISINEGSPYPLVLFDIQQFMMSKAVDSGHPKSGVHH